MVDLNHFAESPQASSSSLPDQISAQEPKKVTSSVHDVNADKPPFGSRFLAADSDVWSKNAWDHVPAPEDQDDRIASALARQQAMPVPPGDRPKYNDKPARHWDNFYKMNNENFFRDRKWLHTEFSELVAATQPDAGPMVIAELGCGAGNSVFPLLTSNQNRELKLYAFDYSHHAVKLVQRNELYSNPPIGSIHASVWDLSSKDGLPDAIQPSSVDIIVLVFVLSALHPSEWSQAVANVHKMLKPGGMVVMRDYGRHDMTQLRFKGGRLLDENLYIRGDKTRVYFFELDDLSIMFTGSPAKPEDKLPVLPLKQGVLGEEGKGKESESNPTRSMSTPSSASCDLFQQHVDFEKLSLADDWERMDVGIGFKTEVGDVIDSQLVNSIRKESNQASQGTSDLLQKECSNSPLFEKVQLGVDRRLLVNRKRQLKMYRVWVQAKFRKLA